MPPKVVRGFDGIEFGSKKCSPRPLIDTKASKMSPKDTKSEPRNPQSEFQDSQSEPHGPPK